MVGSLDCPRGGEEDLGTAAPVLLGDLLLLVLAVVGRLSGSSSEWHSHSSWQGWWCRRGCPTCEGLLDGHLNATLVDGKECTFQMFRSPDSDPDLRIPKVWMV